MEKKHIQKKQIISDIQAFIQEENDFLVTTHVNPDGDSMASALAFGALLNHFNRNYIILLDDAVPKKFSFLPEIDKVIRYDSQKFAHPINHVVVLDSSDLGRIGTIQEIIRPEMNIINIDHHASNQQYGHFNIVDQQESSTAEIVYTIYSLLDVPITPDIATFFYTGILCDTGRFLFPNTTYRSLQICAEMVQKGARPGYIAEQLYCKTSPETIRALNNALSTIKFHFNGLVSCIYLTNGIFASYEKIDTEGFVDYLLAIDGTEVEFFMIEFEPNMHRVSFRSKNRVDVNKVAEKFGGGGHARASGCVIPGTTDEVKKKILKVLESYFS
ncbi:bifunctional oligoribonuclease/PAP phosphatase NrnA [bacterium]|nr:bifunctional oligoribonuclease/PAP phosphatase NrnA [bacterium]